MAVNSNRQNKTANFNRYLRQIEGIVNKYNRGDSLVEKELQQLARVAVRCPFYDGIAVYQARSIDYEYGYPLITNDCEKEPSKVKAQKRLKSETDHTDELDISLYPNPTNGQLTLNYQLEENQTALLRVFDLMGNLVKIEPLKVGSTHNVDMNELSKGIYFVEISNNEKPLFKEKIVLQ